MSFFIIFVIRPWGEFSVTSTHVLYLCLSSLSSSNSYVDVTQHNFSISPLAPCLIPYYFQDLKSCLPSTFINTIGIFTFTADSCKKANHFWSSNSDLLVTPRVRTNISFEVAGRTLWNPLPDSLTTFRCHFKIHVFDFAYPPLRHTKFIHPLTT